MTEGIVDPTPSAPPCGLEDTSRMKRKSPALDFGLHHVTHFGHWNGTEVTTCQLLTWPLRDLVCPPSQLAPLPPPRGERSQPAHWSKEDERDKRQNCPGCPWAPCEQTTQQNMAESEHWSTHRPTRVNGSRFKPLRFGLVCYMA